MMQRSQLSILPFTPHMQPTSSLCSRTVYRNSCANRIHREDMQLQVKSKDLKHDIAKSDFCK